MNRTTNRSTSNEVANAAGASDVDRYRGLRRTVMLASTAVVALILTGVVPPVGAAGAEGKCPKPPPVTHRADKAAKTRAPGAKPDRHGLTGKINLNTATSLELQLLPRVGPTRARRIIAYRARRQFKQIWELRRVKGFGRKTLRKLAPYLVVKGATTLKKQSK